ncbi:hypothetical protein EVC37_09245 [Methylocaldum sp. BRCS4]|nr:hypothetical protein [Methylocaldum sp. BRCS4]
MLSVSGLSWLNLRKRKR